MKRSAWLAVAVVGCSFHASPPGVTTDAQSGQQQVDAPASSSSDAAPDSAQPCTPGFVNVCAAPAPTMPFQVTGTDTINTDSDSRCVTITQATGRAVCLVNATSVSISGTLIAQGS